ncbi:hypothetical protein IWX90DRAFT_136336 [Phyllosticta citrichinensis]|uniref:Uncharacterized protein n=1 Tax=Phyllosticta citrichinensis TaxID=1130410 RepID=A0ABR1XY39_9PEZI
MRQPSVLCSPADDEPPDGMLNWFCSVRPVLVCCVMAVRAYAQLLTTLAVPTAAAVVERAAVRRARARGANMVMVLLRLLFFEKKVVKSSRGVERMLQQSRRFEKSRLVREHPPPDLPHSIYTSPPSSTSSSDPPKRRLPCRSDPPPHPFSPGLAWGPRPNLAPSTIDHSSNELPIVQTRLLGPQAPSICARKAEDSSARRRDG